ncbi:hypothetical protein EOS93_10115 [Rhizobium sp. RMa-01]|uniref:hypothetical protein n=1 Tax=unclassified Rhizobium TaxID=2613769 RepID=UPI0008DAF24E|nr:MULTISPECIES: hypothetical protein [unclassified Rhizobium]OHV26231.1 hypothetical protein BBJ66_05810 [Rhizobium sp. RSm-3]RVU11154.1 hypothetical protein EOS93_10115 [Rhizobium sp. RMa-01]
MKLSHFSRLTHPFSIRGAALTARALTIAESKRLSRRFPQYDFVKVVLDPNRQGDPLMEISEPAQRALVATCLGYGGDAAQEAAVERLTDDERDQIVAAMFALTFEVGGVAYKGMLRNDQAKITIRDVDFKIRLLSQPMFDRLELRFPDLQVISSDPAGIFDCPEPAINAVIAETLGFGGDPIEEAAVAHLNLVEQVNLIALAFGGVPEPESAPPRRSELN